MTSKNILLFFVAALFCAIAIPAHSQTGFTSPEFSVTATFPDSPIKLGSVVYGTISIVMPEGWHVYAPGVKKYNQLNVDTGAGPLEKVRLDYPPAKTMIQLDEKVSVYSGTVNVNVAGLAPSDHAGGEMMFSAIVTWQGCTDNICLAPESRVVQVPLKLAEGK